MRLANKFCSKCGNEFKSGEKVEPSGAIGDVFDYRHEKCPSEQPDNQTITDSRPGHYKVGGIEPIEYMKMKMSPTAYRGFLLGNVIKYVSRYEYKGDTLKDLKKAKQYLDWLVEEVEKEAPVE